MGASACANCPDLCDGWDSSIRPVALIGPTRVPPNAPAYWPISLS
jgi:hypothetical protein